MAENTSIEWADHTFNPWTGCTKVSLGCDHCYAEAMMDTRLHRVQWGAGQPRQRTTPENWRKPLQWQADAERFQAEHGRRQRVFCASLADVFDNEVDPNWRLDLFAMIVSTPHLDWLLLTKRIGTVKHMVADIMWKHLPNVWLGATIVNQAEADRDIPKLLAVPAAVRFLSVEPMLGPVDLTNVAPPTAEGRVWHGVDSITPANRELRGCIDWIICGGESGPNARPMHPDWARSLRDQCAAAGVPFLFKQWGQHMPWERREPSTDYPWVSQNGKSTVLPPKTSVGLGAVGLREIVAESVGKKAAGRLLDGIEHNGFPT